MRARHIVIATLAAAAALAACTQRQQQGVVSIPPSPAAEATHGLENVFPLNDRIFSGSSPAGAAAFDQLQSMGIRTIISVDGGTPDVAAAEARGMRYVHVPVTYATITSQQQLEIARAIRDLPGPAYIHCHHGKHRGPAAAAAAAVLLGMLTPESAVEFMHRAGTAESYTGLFACVASAQAATQEMLDQAPAEFPSVRRAQGLVAAMVEADLAFEHLGHIRAAGWKTPAQHPDLVPAAEAGRLADNLRISGEDPRSSAKGAEFLQLLVQSVEDASALEEQIVRARPARELEATFAKVKASCKECHVKYRDR